MPERYFKLDDSTIWDDTQELEYVGKPLASESTTRGSSFVLFYLHNRMSWFDTLSKPTELWVTKSHSETEGLIPVWESFHRTLSNKQLESRQPPETRWIQNLKNSAYHLRQPIPIVIESDAGVVTATYDDLDLIGTGGDMKAAMSDLCGQIVELYEAAQHCVEGADRLPNQEYAFLQQIIAEVQPKAWDEVQEAYHGKLKAFPFVEKGYINISASDFADVIIILSDESAERIEQLAEIDLEINLKFRPLYFFVEYESSEDYLDLDNYVRFY